MSMFRTAAVGMLVVLTQEVFTVVVPVGSAQYSMNVFSRWLATAKRSHTTLVIELNQHDRTVNAIVVDTLISRVTDPGKVGSVEMLFDLLHFYFQ